MNIDKVPSNLERAFEILDGMPEESKAQLKSNDFSSFHHTLGQWLRNNWSLWIEDTPFVIWFNNQGIRHADDMSSIILEAYICKLRGTSFDLQAKIDYYRKFWQESGLDPDTMKKIDK